MFYFNHYALYDHLIYNNITAPFHVFFQVKRGKFTHVALLFWNQRLLFAHLRPSKVSFLQFVNKQELHFKY